MKSIIKVENLSKQYSIGLREVRYATLRESLMGILRAPLALLRRSSGATEEMVWALKDVNFEIRPGQIVGVIGRNGAGKSTLLKILSRITEPTTGRVELYGRVGSLLEVGTGFHPELTGRENIYLNGAIIGMKKREIDSKFDEIVAFAEVERFIDTPVKRYSSGMYLRLAFAVAAHLETEILVVDEVLAVGDAQFQKKCIGKMGDVAKGGRTVLFVSHHMAAIEALCNRCLLFSQGRLTAMGEPSQIIAQYLSSDIASDTAYVSLLSHTRRTHSSFPIMTAVALFSELDMPVTSVRMGAPLSVQVNFNSPSKPLQPVLGLVIKNAHGMPIFGVNNRFIPGYRFDEQIAQGTI
ncbi:MAG: polysaccharide ABC transporter ATP-binding protein, partial [Acidobacteriota bacterium]